MARYSREHKLRSHAAIVAAAAKLFRRRGYGGVGIDDICAEAGLTRGAFYGHFRSKSDLYNQVVGGNHDLVRRLSERRSRTDAGLLREATRIAGQYLDPTNSAGVLGGCTIASLAMETIRSQPAAKAAYAAAVDQLAAEFTRGMSDADGGSDRALAAIALCVGGLLVSNACGNAPIGRRIALAARRIAGGLLEEVRT
jgi:AcrR family transcriptional regulator